MKESFRSGRVGSGVRAGWMAVTAVLCLAAAVVFSCGDFSYNAPGGGNGNGNGNSNGNGSLDTCENAFPGLAFYVEVLLSNPDKLEILDSSLQDPVAVAVVPAGMTFEFTPPGSTTVRTSVEGDFFVADRGAGATAGKIYFYDSSQADRRFVFEDAFTRPAGLALLTSTVTGSGGQDEQLNLLFFTDGADLYLYDLDDRDPTDNPRKIPDDFVFTAPTGLAVGESSSKTSLFVVDGGTRVVRIDLDLSSTTPEPDGSGVIADGFTSLQDVAHFTRNDSVYLSRQPTVGLEDSRVYRIPQALTRTSIQRETSAERFVEWPAVLLPGGLVLAPTSQDEKTAELLGVSQQSFDVTVGQFDPADATDRAFLGIQQNFLVDVAYDCTNQRLLLSQTPQNETEPNLFAIRP